MRAAIAIVALLFVSAAACVVGGVTLLAGPAWALIVSGFLLFGFGVALRMGLRHG